MATTDPFTQSDRLDAATSKILADRLEARKENQAYMNMLADYLGEADLGSCRDLLVLGAGTGVEVRHILTRPEFAGRITAQDLSPHLVEVGRQETGRTQEGHRVTWISGDARATGLPDASYDIVLAHTLMSHVDGPDLVLAEARRLLRPGGQLVIFDGDYATLTFGTEDAEDGAMWDQRITTAFNLNPRIMRMLPRMLARHGFRIARWRSYAFHEIGTADFFLASLRAYPVMLPRTGVATAEEAEAFVRDQLAASERGEFFAGYNFLAYICTAT